MACESAAGGGTTESRATNAPISDGGIGRLHGAIIGALAFLLIEEWLSGVTEHWKMIFGPFLVLVVLFARGGLIGAWNEIFARLRPGARHG